MNATLAMMLAVSIVGCLVVYLAPRDSVREIAGATLAIAPWIALLTMQFTPVV